MRIVIPVTCLAKGGGIRFLVEIGNGLSRYGHDLTFAVLAGQPVEYPVQGRLVQIAALAPKYMPAADVVLPNFYLTVPAALSGRGMPVRMCLGYEPLFVEQAAAAAATYHLPMPIATISQCLQRILLERAGRRSALINPGLDHTVFHANGASRDATTIVCLARRQQGPVYWFKGFPQFVQAMTIVHAARPGVRVIVASPDLQDLPTPFPSALARSPSDAELAELYRRATVFVFPSLLEGFGLPPLEAMACGAPVVTTACGGVSDYALDEVNCLMVPPGDPEALARAILRLLIDPPLRRRLSAAAVETARPWTWTRTVDQMDAFLRRVLRGDFEL